MWKASCICHWKPKSYLSVPHAVWSAHYARKSWKTPKNVAKTGKKLTKIDPGNQSFLPSFLQGKHRIPAHLWMPFILIPAVQPQLWEQHRACCSMGAGDTTSHGTAHTMEKFLPSTSHLQYWSCRKTPLNLGQNQHSFPSFDSQFSFLRTGLWNQVTSFFFSFCVHKTTIKICHLDKINNPVTSAPSHSIKLRVITIRSQTIKKFLQPCIPLGLLSYEPFVWLGTAAETAEITQTTENNIFILIFQKVSKAEQE